MSATSSASSEAMPLEAVRVRVASHDSSPRAIRISTASIPPAAVSPNSQTSDAPASSLSYSSSSPMSARSRTYESSASLPTSPAPFDGIVSGSDAGRIDLSHEIYVDDDEYDVFSPNSKASPSTVKKLDAFLDRTQTQFKKIHMPANIKQVSADTLTSLKSITPSGNHRSLAQYNYDLVETLQTELRLVSVELATSIKREIDLESLLDQFATVNDDPADQEPVAELSDGSSSINDDDELDESAHVLRRAMQPGLEKIRILERRLRQEQQEKAQMRLDFQKLMDSEREGRREAEEKRKKLEEQLKVNCSFLHISSNIGILE